MVKFEQQIILNASIEDLTYVIYMFSALTKALSSEDISSEGRRILIRKKTSEEIFEFDANLGELKNMILEHFDKGQTKALTLSESDSDLFEKCSHAAYYYVFERKDADQNFLRTHEKHFRH